jgi:release factor glutamine methyltransferase
MTTAPDKRRPSLREALAHGRATLARHRCARTDAAREAEALLCAAARVTREEAYTHPERALSPAVARRYDAALARRLAHEPLEYIIGYAQFDRLTLQVNHATLVPRPATETLVEAAMAVATTLAGGDAKASCLRIADIGTGSGCIALALASRLPEAEVVATDESASALRTARTNARRLGLAGRVRFMKGNLAAPVLSAMARGKATLIVTNPPYIPSGMMHRLPVDVRLHEPASALVAGRDGLDCYRALLDQIQACAPNESITLVGEHLDTQFAGLAKEIRHCFPSAKPEPIRNLAGVVIGTTCVLSR